MDAMAQLLADRGIAVARFEFDYMAARRTGGKRRPPPGAERLVPEFRRLVSTIRPDLGRGQRLLIGGKSMGGRVASLVADELLAAGKIDGLVCLGYPFHPPTRPSELRIGHLIKLATPCLIVQGERDPFGSRAEIEALALSPGIHLHWLADGDHDFGPRGGRGPTRRGNLAAAADAVAGFALALARERDGEVASR